MFDVHSHKIENQTGGFILSIEGQPAVIGGLSFIDLIKTPVPNGFFAIPYININNFQMYAEEKIIYIHPRRNNFSPAQVIELIADSAAKLVIIDTFSSFFWTAQDYFNLLKTFPSRHFLLAHGGGYRIKEFIEVCRYSPNALIDFSATQEIFGCVNNNPQLDCNALSAIVHALTEPRVNSKVLFGSDNPEFNQLAAYEFYSQIDKTFNALMQDNYHRIIDVVG